MKKKIVKKKKPSKQKIDVAIESLVNLEQRVKELIKRVEELERLSFALYYKNSDKTHYWRYNGITWTT